jgi:hypothetical protein
MKKIVIIVAALALFVSAKCQLTAGFNVAVNLPTAGIALPGFIQVEKNGSEKAIVATLGAGLNFNGELGYQINSNIAFNLGFGFFKSFKGGFYQYYDTDPSTNGFQNNGARADIDLAASFIHVSPNIVVSANGTANKLKPYARFGLIIGSGKATVTATATGAPGKDVSVYDGGTSIGFLGGLGLQKRLNDKLSLFTELTSKTITSYPKTLTNRETFSFPGAEKSPTVAFQKELKYGYDGPDQLTFALPYSSIGLTFGLIYTF